MEHANTQTFSLRQSFHKKYPHITFEIFQGSYEDIIDWLKTGIVDIGFLSKTVNPGFPFYEVFSDPLMCILRKGTNTPSETEIPLESLANTPFIMADRGYRHCGPVRYDAGIAIFARHSAKGCVDILFP